MYAGGVNFTSILFMNVYLIYFLFDLTKRGRNFFLSLFMPLCWWFDKKGERILEFYICMFKYLEIGDLYMHGYFLFTFPIGIKSMFLLFPCFIYELTKRGEKSFETLYVHVYVFLNYIRAYMFCLYKKRRSILHLCIFALSIHWISLCLLLCMS